MAPCIIRPQRNIEVTAANRSAPRPLRLSRKCPPPGTSQPSATAGPQALTGGMGCFCSFSLAIAFPLSVAGPPVGLPRGAHPAYTVLFDARNHSLRDRTRNGGGYAH